MSNSPHDDFAKEYLTEICRDYGETISSADVRSEIRQVDILFNPTKEFPTSANTLGLLRKMLQKTCLLKIYRNSVKPEDIRKCLGKLFDVRKSKIKLSRREERKVALGEFPILWIINRRCIRKFWLDLGQLRVKNGMLGFIFWEKSL